MKPVSNAIAVLLSSSSPNRNAVLTGKRALMSTTATITALNPNCGVPTLQFGQIISALTYALDLTEGHPQGHALRTCILGMRLGKRIGLDDDELCDLF